MEDRLNWSLAANRGQDGNSDDEAEYGSSKLGWRSLYTEERHKEKDPSLLDPKVDQWRMKDRVREYHP